MEPQQGCGLRRLCPDAQGVFRAASRGSGEDSLHSWHHCSPQPFNGALCARSVGSQPPACTHRGQNRSHSHSDLQAVRANSSAQSCLTECTAGLLPTSAESMQKRKALQRSCGQTQTGCIASGSAPLLQVGKLRQWERPCPHFPRQDVEHFCSEKENYTGAYEQRDLCITSLAFGPPRATGHK